MGGLDSVLEMNPQATVVVHEGFSKHLLKDLHGLCGELVVVGADPAELAPSVFSTGILDSDPPEHAMVIEDDGVTAAISGCAHPGMERIVEQASRLLGKKINWAIGGFHLMYSDASGIDRAIRALQAFDVAYVVPTHCTGDAAGDAVRHAFGARCIDGGVGREIGLVGRVNPLGSPTGVHFGMMIKTR
ncbi:MBL fold metallo-hydrolase [Thiocapsa bogorovii]|nr:MBL fold metallo-hydrolase [Thiocapsa bogorovii]